MPTRHDPRFTEEANAAIAELLPNASDVGKFCMGIVAGLAHSEGLQPDRRLLYNASVCSGPLGADVVFEAWLRERKTA